MNKIIVISVLLVIAIAVFFGVSMKKSTIVTPGALDGFTQCLKEKKAIFYGAFWCSRCETQKKLFGSSVRFLPYVECSTPNGKAQTAECAGAKVTGYPTWQFVDDTREIGLLELAYLAEKTGCVLPTAQ